MSSNFTFNPDEAANLLGLMGNGIRLRVLRLISEREWDVTSLATKVSLSQSALSQHLKKLRDADVVETRRVGHTIYYSCKHEGVARMIAAIA